MALYEYQCLECGARSEVLQKMADAPLTTCTVCGGRLKKLASSPSVQFKGSGWYVTDYARKGGGGKEAGGKEGGEKSGEGKGEGKAGEGKPAESKAAGDKGSGGESKPAASGGASAASGGGGGSSSAGSSGSTSGGDG